MRFGSIFGTLGMAFLLGAGDHIDFTTVYNKGYTPAVYHDNIEGTPLETGRVEFSRHRYKEQEGFWIEGQRLNEDHTLALRRYFLSRKVWERIADGAVFGYNGHNARITPETEEISRTIIEPGSASTARMIDSMRSGIKDTGK